jgi:oxalate---CoA ligase
MPTLIAELRRIAEQTPTAIALAAPGRTPLTFAQLIEHLDHVARALAAHGVRTEDRVAVVLPNGPEMASTFLAVASVATCAPLNPAYREAELEFYLDDLRPKVLMVARDLDSPAAAVARARSIAVVEVAANATRPAGSYELAIPSAARGSDEPTQIDPEAVALVLHTSGTTARPKIVPLSQQNLVASARHIRETLQLTAADRCLNVMPLFHIHGLIAGLTASLLAGGSVVCTPGFDAAKLNAWLRELGPTWITAVPTIHEAIASLAAAQPEVFRNSQLRFLRSSSASLAPQLMRTLEDATGVPVIEAYGMTEAAHQMASNPLPPRVRKPGSVGVAAGPDVAIMHPQASRLLPTGERGEIVICGPNVTRGYLDNPTANSKAFTDGWFRTGDQGYLDEDGYLFISGRLKELINRGGEKISPREVDEALLGLPGVKQAICFAMPHATLGEEIAAAIVRQPNAQLTEADVRRRLLERLAPFKVPARVLFVDAIPKGPTGKLQRIGLYDKFAKELAGAYVAPSTPLEQTLAEIFAEVLGVAQVGVHDNFFAQGGDSLRAIRLTALAADRGLALPVDAVFREPTVAGIAPLTTELKFNSAGGEHAEGKVRLYGFQRVILFPTNLTPELFTSPSELVFASDRPIDVGALRAAVRALTEHHDAFRFRYTRDGDKWTQTFLSSADVQPEAAIQWVEPSLFEERFKALRETFDLGCPPLFKFIATSGSTPKVGIIGHHLVADAISMQVLAEDFVQAYEQALAGREISLPRVPTPMVSYQRRYDEAFRNGGFAEDVPAWLSIAQASPNAAQLPLRTGAKQPARMASIEREPMAISTPSARILAYAQAERLSVNEVLIAATSIALAEQSPSNDARLLMLSSGRDVPVLGDLSRTIGCLAQFVPVVVDLTGTTAPREAQSLVKAAVRALPKGGISAAGTLSADSDARWPLAKTMYECQAVFNYKGVLGPRSARAVQSAVLRAERTAFDEVAMFARLKDPRDEVQPCLCLQAHFEIVGSELVGDFHYAADYYDRQFVCALAARVREALTSLVG